MAIDQAATLTGSSSFPITEVCVLLDWADLVVAAPNRICRCRAFLHSRNPNRFDIRELTNAFRPQLASVAGPFHSAEWHARI